MRLKTTLKKGERTLIENCWLASDFFSRLIGLMGRRALGENEAIFFPNCSSIHTFFVRFPIDVISVSAEGTVLSVQENLAPWRLLLPKRFVSHVIEVQGGLSRRLGIAPGTRLTCKGVWD